MKKTLKLVGIFIAILTIGITGGLSVYFLIQNNKTYYIYDLRIIEPVAEANTYIYTNKENKYATLKNQTVYMTAESDNLLQIAVFTDTTADMSKLKIQSSDRSVADIVYVNGRCFVEYKKAGEVKITASIDMVKDSFDLCVYNRPAAEFNVYDLTYYGKYAEKFANKLIAYADDKIYDYDFSTISAFYVEGSEEEVEDEIVEEPPVADGEVVDGETPEETVKKPIINFKGDDETVNGDLLEIDNTSVNTDIFSKVSIDAATRKVSIQCKSSISEALIAEGKPYVDESIVIQSYYYSTEGEKKPLKSYVVDVHVIPDTPEFLQVEVAATPDFKDSYIFMDTEDFTDATEETISSNIESFLKYQKAEQYLLENEEKSTYTAFFTDKVSEIYLKFRKVYTNGDIVYLDEITKQNGNPFDFDAATNSTGYLTLSQNKEYYTLKIDKTYFESNNNKFDIELTLGDITNFSRTFTFEFKEFTAENAVKYFYKFDHETMTFTYKYWDLRTRYYNEICDPAGNVIDFGGIEIDFDALIPEKEDEQVYSIKFVSALKDDSTGKAIFEVVLGVSFELVYERSPAEDTRRVTFTIVDSVSAQNRSRFSFDNGVIKVSSSNFEQIEVKVEINGVEASDTCYIRLKKTT